MLTDDLRRKLTIAPGDFATIYPHEGAALSAALRDLEARAADLEAERDQLEQDLSDMRDNAESAYRRGYYAGMR